MTDTVTLTRTEYDKMRAQLDAYARLREETEDAEDLAIAAERENDETIPGEMVTRMLAGESPVTVWREYRGLTMSALAKAADLSAATIHAIENSQRTPSLPAARAIARALGADLDDLFGD